MINIHPAILNEPQIETINLKIRWSSSDNPVEVGKWNICLIHFWIRNFHQNFKSFRSSTKYYNTDPTKTQTDTIFNSILVNRKRYSSWKRNFIYTLFTISLSEPQLFPIEIFTGRGTAKGIVFSIQLLIMSFTASTCCSFTSKSSSSCSWSTRAARYPCELMDW